MSEPHKGLVIAAMLAVCLPGGRIAAAQPEGALLDPTRPAGWREPAVGQVQAVEQPAVSLRLQGTFSVGGKRSAMISGQRVAVGDRVAGAEVMEIERDKVTLRVDGETVELASTVPEVKVPAALEGEWR